MQDASCSCPEKKKGGGKGAWVKWRRSYFADDHRGIDLAPLLCNKEAPRYFWAQFVALLSLATAKQKKI